MSTVLGLATGGMPMIFGWFGYRCDSCEFLAFGYNWLPQEQNSPSEYDA
jgi:hypothetical protein